jgi:Uma2 family endonuclease
MALAAAEHFYTPEEYLELERQAPFRSEYLGGRIYAMAGASREHSLIIGNVLAEFHQQLKGRPCEVYTNEMRVKVEAEPFYTYPDVVVVCGERRFEDAEVDTLLNPTALVEVLSPSTESYDRTRKFEYYGRLASLREYVLIAQDRVLVEQYLRQGEKWAVTELRDLDAALVMPSIGCEVPLREIYDRVEPEPHSN